MNVHSSREETRTHARLDNWFVEMRVSATLDTESHKTRIAKWLFHVSLLLLYGDTYTKNSDQSSRRLTCQITGNGAHNLLSVWPDVNRETDKRFKMWGFHKVSNALL